MIYLTYITSGCELATADALTASGFDVWVGRKLDLVRKGKRRMPDVVESPYLPNYAFITLDDDAWHRLHRKPPKHMASTMYLLRRDDEEGLKRFRSEVDADYAYARRCIEREGNLSEFRDGQQIRAITGPLAEHVLTFRRIVEGFIPLVEADVELFGRITRVQIDVLDVKAAE